MSEMQNKHRKSYPWILLALLWVAFLLHQSGRQAYNVLVPLIKADLGLSDVQIGLVSTCFTLIYGIVVPFAGFLGDVWQKRLVIIFSILVLSTGNFLTGFAGGMLSLLIVRSLANGVGEAVFFPPACAVLGEYHEKSRGTALAILQTALYASAVLSAWGAGWLGKHFGWRSAFYVSGVAGLACVAVIYFVMRNDDLDAQRRHVESQGSEPRVKPRLTEVVRALARIPAVYFFCLAFGAQIFVGFGFRLWMPTYLVEKFGMELDNAGFNSMVYAFAMAFIGILVGARLGDKFALHHSKARVIVKGVGQLLAGIPFFLIFFTNSLTTIYLCLAAYGFFRGLYESNMWAALYDSVPRRYRSSAGGVMLAFGFSLGALSSVILGAIKQYFGLEWGWLLLGIVYCASGLMLLLTKRWVHHHKDNGMLADG